MRTEGSNARRSVWDYLRPYKRRLGIGIALLLALNALDKAVPYLLLHAIDALKEQRLLAVRNFALLVIGVALVMWPIRTLSRTYVFNVGRDVEYDLRNELLARVHLLGASFFRRMPTGEIMSRATNDLGQVRLLIGFGVLHVVNSAAAYAGGIALMITISPRLTLYALLPYPLVIVVTRYFGKAMFKLSRDSQQALAKLADRAQENVAGVRVVRTFAVEAHEQARFEEVNREVIDKNMAIVKLRGFSWPLLMGITSLGTLIVVWKGGTMMVDGEITVGQFAAFSAYLGQLVWPTLAFGWLISIVQRGRASYARVREVLDAEPDIMDMNNERLVRARGALRVDDLVYERGAEKVLSGVTLSVPEGGSLAIVGRTGSGKSTLAALLSRMLPTPDGTVFLDEHDVNTLPLRDVRRNVAFAQQEPFLFSTTIANNIGFGLDDPEAPNGMERVRRAAEESAILPEIESLPDGFETVVGERGVQLSGGQKQRIALARALLREPTVVVLDDPLSSVDARTEAAILTALDRAGEGRTMVLITHRVAAAARTERIIVLDRGRILEQGTHEELLRTGGLYSQLAARQRLEAELQAL